jgi:hypothetical protein
MQAGATQEATARVLVMLLRFSLAKGHFKVAWQRLLMMEACGLQVPATLRAQCERYSARLTPAEWKRMRRAALEFAQVIAFAGRTGAPPPALGEKLAGSVARDGGLPVTPAQREVGLSP